MAINSRSKGQRGEREFARLLEQETGCSLTRNLAQSRNGGHDLLLATGPASRFDLLNQFAIEVKRGEAVTPSALRNWFDQAQRQADRVGKTPLLAYRPNRSPWRVQIPLKTFSNKPYHTGICELSIEDFINWLISETN